MNHYYAPCAPGVEPALAEELQELGATGLEQTRGGVRFRGHPPIGQKVCLWSRVALRVYEELVEGPVEDQRDLYDMVRSVDWMALMEPQQTLAVHASVQSAQIRNSKFAALKVKDAVCDAMRDAVGQRPWVDTKDPDVPLKLVVKRGSGRLYRDLAGESLHKRGWRPIQVKGPLNESLAAGLLRLSGWDPTTPLLDPMCGSGTFLIEAAQRAADRAPGLQRGFAFQRWVDFDEGAWEALREDAQARARAGRERVPALMGADAHDGAISIAERSAEQAGVGTKVRFTHAPLTEFTPAERAHFVVVNPPYGRRLGEGEELVQVWKDLGQFLRKHCADGEAWVLSGNPELPRYLRFRADQKVPVTNTSLDCRWLRYTIGAYRGDR